MHMIIVGCGRVGSTVARQLDADGHDVVVIDRKESAFRRLGDSFGGRTLTGIGFDRDLLQRAGISSESSVMAVTNGDNSNILIARVAREMYGVQRVVARIYDPKRAAIYERLGIATVATVAWASNRVLQTVLPQLGTTTWSDPTSTYHLAERRVERGLAGTAVSDLPAKVVLMVRNGEARIPADGAVAQEGDILHLLATNAELAAFDAGTPTEGGHQ